MRKGLRIFSAVVALSLTGGLAQAVPAPVVPSASTGTYTVTYQPCSDCYMHWLEESVGDSGVWTAIANGNKTFTAKPYGRYSYRVGYAYFNPYYGYSIEYGPVASVTVAGAVPTASPLDAQLTYRYETRRGDINGDGRVDLYVARIAGGAAGDGALDQALLRQAASGTFAASAPTASEAQTARGWAVAAARVLLKDVNADGFADVVLDRVAQAVGASGALNQIVYAPAEPLKLAPRGIRAVDATFKKFATDTASYFREPTYFIDNAPVTVVFETHYQLVCSTVTNWESPLFGEVPSCYYAPVIVGGVYPDYSGFSRAAVDLWTYETLIGNGQMSTDQGQANIQRVLDGIASVGVGGWSRREVIDAEITNAAYRRGLEFFAALLRMGETGEGEPKESGTASRTADTVYIVGRRIVGVRAMHTALEHRGSTISAYDSIDGFFRDGTLVSAVNWRRDRPLLMMTLGTVAGPVAASVYWGQLLAADGRYPDNLPYDAIPSIGRGGYNSNGYAHGIMLATAGRPSIPMNRFIGGERPVPSSSFR